MGLFDYSTTASSNTAISGINIAEGWPPPNVNNAFRQMMADLAGVGQLTISTVSFVQAGDADFYPSLKRAITFAHVVSTPVAKIVLPASANLSMASASILADGGSLLITKPMVIDGNGSTITITGVAVTEAIFKFLNCSGGVRNLKLYGNSCGTTYVNGSAIVFETSGAATADTANVEVIDCDFDNFRSPYWVYIMVSHPTYGVRRGRISGCFFQSRDGNQMQPTVLGQNVSFICAQSTKNGDVLTGGGGGIENLTVYDCRGDGNYVKCGVQFFRYVYDSDIHDCVFWDCGKNGAGDDAGAYAILCYDTTDVGMANITVSNIRAVGARSCGVYCAGLIPGLVVSGIYGKDILDTVDGSLPKAVVCINGTADATVSNVKAVNAHCAFAYVANDHGYNSFSVHDIDAYHCNYGAKLTSSYIETKGLVVDGLVARECLTGISLEATTVGTSMASGWKLSNFDIQSSRVDGASAPAGIGVRVFPQGGVGVVNVKNIYIGGSSRIAVNHTGLDVRGDFAGRVVIKDIEFEGDLDNVGLWLTENVMLEIDDIGFANITTGYAISAALAQGTAGRAIRFTNVVEAKQIAVTGLDFMRNTPTWSASKSAYVRNISTDANGRQGWVNVDGGTTWKACDPINA